MPRKPNPTHSAYYMGLLTSLLAWAIEDYPKNRPTDKKLLHWFSEKIPLCHHLGKVPTPEAAKKSYSKMWNSPWNCCFDTTTLDGLCRILAMSLPICDFKDYQTFLQWAGEVPEGVDENELVQIAQKMVIREYHVEKTKGIFETTTEKNAGFERLGVAS